jgi:hypothetical protein
MAEGWAQSRTYGLPAELCCIPGQKYNCIGALQVQQHVAVTHVAKFSTRQPTWMAAEQQVDAGHTSPMVYFSVGCRAPCTGEK